MKEEKERKKETESKRKTQDKVKTDMRGKHVQKRTRVYKLAALLLTTDCLLAVVFVSFTFHVRTTVASVLCTSRSVSIHLLPIAVLFLFLVLTATLAHHVM